MSPFYSATRDPRERERERQSTCRHSIVLPVIPERERERQSTCHHSIVLPVIPERERERVNMSPFYSATRDPRERERDSQHVTIL